LRPKRTYDYFFACGPVVQEIKRTAPRTILTAQGSESGKWLISNFYVVIVKKFCSRRVNKKFQAKIFITCNFSSLLSFTYINFTQRAKFILDLSGSTTILIQDVVFTGKKKRIKTNLNRQQNGQLSVKSQCALRKPV
jgi:hypothetical protein